KFRVLCFEALGFWFKVSGLLITAVREREHQKLETLNPKPESPKPLIARLSRTFFFIRLPEVLLNNLLGVVVVAAAFLSFVVFGDGSVSIVFRIPRVAALDIRPDLEPRRFQITVHCFGESVTSLLPVALLDIQQTYLVPGPRRTGVEFQRRAELLFGLGVFLALE